MRKILGLFLGLALWVGLVAPSLAVLIPTYVGNVAYTILPTDVNVVTTTSFTAARTWTLPSAGGTCIGQSCQPPAAALTIYDVAGAINGTSLLTIAPASGETINGNAANLILNAAGVRVTLVPTSGSNWNAYITGDYYAAAVASASAVALTTATAADITSLQLSQGDWECRGAITRKLAATTSVTLLKTSISATSATSGSLDTGTMVQKATAANVMALDNTVLIGPIRLKIAATATYYLVAQDTFTVSTNAGYGQLSCRRVI